MKPQLGAVTLAVALATLVAAAPPVALRVETAAIRAEGDGVLMAVTVQVAPEDRSRLGRDVWVQCELMRGGQRVQRLARALDLDERGEASFEVAWPAGDYDLRVSIEGAGDRAAGLWVGPLSVPATVPAAPAVAAAPVATVTPATPPSEPLPAPRPEPTVTAAVAPEPATEAQAAEPVPFVAAAAVAAAEPVPTVALTEPPPAPQPEATPQAEETPEKPAAVPVPVLAATAAAAVKPSEPPPAPRPEPTVTAEVVSEPTEQRPSAEPAPVAAATAAAVKPAEIAPPPEPEVAPPEVVPAEPAAAPPPVTQPAAAPPAEIRPAPAAEPTPAPVQPVPAVAAGMTGAAWAAANLGLTDATVFVTERNRPILGLDASAFTLRVGGSGAAVEAVGDAASAPLNLALVADVAPNASELVDELARQLGRFSLRARSGGDLLVVTTTEPHPGWGAGADAITRWADGATAGRPDDLAGLVAAAAQAAAGRRGRSVLVVVTDGSDACGKAAWKEASAAAEAAGVPVFTIGLRDSGFDDQARAGLSRIADATGGRSYFLGSAGMAGMTLDYLGELIDASYALAFRQPAAGAGPRELKVEAVNRDWDVHHPRRIP